MNWFLNYLSKTDDRSLTKWEHYFDIYDREFSKLRERPITFLEIGIFKGGSIPMWRAYFDKRSTLVFVDIDPDCTAHGEAGCHIEIGNQADPSFLTTLAEKYGPFDVILDDGSHVCRHQIASFEGLWPHIQDHGLYVVEDCHSSYWPGFGGGYRNEASFIEFAKRKVDAMHSWYTDQDAMFPFDPIARELAGVRFYDSITVLEKHQTTDVPTTITARNGEVKKSHRALQVRNRTSIFKEPGRS